MKILVINAGSSSLKYQLIDMTTREVIAKGLCDRIGIINHGRLVAVGTLDELRSGSDESLESIFMECTEGSV